MAQSRYNESKQSLLCEAWLLVGLSGSTSGSLRIANGRIAFTARGCGALSRRHLRRIERMCALPDVADRLRQNHHVTLFDWKIADLDNAVFPWYYFGGGAHFASDGVRFRISFLRPQNTVAGHVGMGEILRNLRSGRANGRVCRHLLMAARSQS